MVNLFLDEMAKEAKNIITTVCDEQCNLSDRLLPKHCAALIAQVVNKKKKPEKGSASNHTGTAKRNAAAAAIAANYPLERPGNESYRKTREDLTTMDKLHMALTELSFSLNHTSTINVWEYTFAPREYLNQHLETRYYITTVPVHTILERLPHPRKCFWHILHWRFRFSRALSGMVMFSPETSEIAKPSELLTSVRAYMNVLQV